jgi:hypothetical protein
MARGTGALVVLYPRMKGEAAPVVMPIAAGKGVKVQHALGADYVFLSATPFTFDEDGIRFEGTAGVVQVRGRESFLALGSAGTLSAPGAKPITSDLALPKQTANLFPDGDFEGGKLGQFPAEANLLKFRVAANPKPDAVNASKQCLAAELAGPRTAFGTSGTYYVDASKRYRFSMKVYTTAKISVEVGGYGSDGKNINLPKDGGGVWQWGFWKKGPLEGWTTMSCTLGPAGSGADLVFPAGILSTHMTFWITGEPGTFYLDDVTMEEIEEK